MLDKLGVVAVPFVACCTTSIAVAPVPFPILRVRSQGRPLLAVHWSARSKPGDVLKGWKVQFAAKAGAA